MIRIGVYELIIVCYEFVVDVMATSILNCKKNG